MPETTKAHLQERLRQLAQLWTLMMIAREMGWDEKLREEEEQVRAMWIKLRKEHGVT